MGQLSNSDDNSGSDAAPITQLLQRAGQGDQKASEQLMPLIYERLRGMARQQMYRQSTPAGMSTTVLVHEAWITLLSEDARPLSFEDRKHFFRYAARSMRNILIDRIRNEMAAKRGGGAIHVELEDQQDVAHWPIDELLALDEGMSRLSKINPELGELVEMRFFAGLEVREVAEVMGVAERTVVRNWRKARILLKGLLEDGHAV